MGLLMFWYRISDAHYIKVKHEMLQKGYVVS